MVANIKITFEGGSSKVFKKALTASLKAYGLHPLYIPYTLPLLEDIEHSSIISLILL